jgi:hypothetical protein
VTGPVRPALRLAAGEPDQVPRLAAFRAAHPEVIIGDLGFGTVWQARIPEETGETVITRYTLGELLDKLGVICPDLQARAARPPPGAARPGGRASTTGRGQQRVR